MYRIVPALFVGMLACTATPDPAPPPVEPDCDCTGRICGRLECGKNCGTCPDDGVCNAEGSACTPARALGAACQADIECGSGRLCLRNSTHQPGGYCTRRCSENDPCPNGETCELERGGERVCIAGCDECRTSEGYSCSEALCRPCVGTCEGRECGDDGCGGECGVVFTGVPACDDAGEVCSANACGFSFIDTADLTSDRYDITALEVNGAVVLVGGRGVVSYAPDAIVRSRGVALVERYDTGARTFTALTPLPEPIALPHAALVGDTIYVAGGTLDVDDRESPDGIVSSFYKQNGALWQKILSANIPEPSRAGAADSLGGGLLLLPGMTSEGVSKGFWRFDPVSQSWSALDSRPVARSHFAVANDGEALWVVGGWDGSKALATVERWSEGAGWQPMPDLPVPVAAPRAVVAGGRLFVFGGYEGPYIGDSRPHVQIMELESRRVELAGTMYESRMRQAPVRLRDGSVLLFGGQTDFGQTPIPSNDVLRFVLPLR